MRPDEHKKKKNIAYKKKHGISNKDKTAATEDESSKKSGKKSQHPRNQTQQNTKPATTTTATASNHQASAKLSEDTVITSSDSEGEQETRHKGSTFKRRDIVSNWEKYELDLESEEKITSRGESFEKLLNMAGDSMAEFRFRDELEWEKEEQDSTSSDFVSVNPESLAQSLACIPLHEMLGVDPSLFPDDQMEELLKAANEKKVAVSPSGEVFQLSSHEKSSDIASTNCSTRLSKDTKTLNANCNNNSDTGEEKTTLELQSNKSKTDNLQIRKSTNLICSPIGLEDDDLDQLLDMDVGRSVTLPDVSNQKGDVKHVPPKNKSLNPAKLTPEVSGKKSASLEDDDLDQLLGLDVGRPTHLSGSDKPKANTEQDSQSQNCISSQVVEKSIPGTTKPSTNGVSTKEKNGTTKESAELEDWLDSILS